MVGQHKKRNWDPYQNSIFSSKSNPLDKYLVQTSNLYQPLYQSFQRFINVFICLEHMFERIPFQILAFGWIYLKTRVQESTWTRNHAMLLLLLSTGTFGQWATSEDGFSLLFAIFGSSAGHPMWNGYHLESLKCLFTLIS